MLGCSGEAVDQVARHVVRRLQIPIRAEKVG